jgi:hypothetical protein
MKPLNVITATGHISNRLGGTAEVLILVGCPSCVMEAVTYGRKKVSPATKWDNNGRSDRESGASQGHLGIGRKGIGVLQ